MITTPDYAKLLDKAMLDEHDICTPELLDFLFDESSYSGYPLRNEYRGRVGGEDMLATFSRNSNILFLEFVKKGLPVSHKASVRSALIEKLQEMEDFYVVTNPNGSFPIGDTIKVKFYFALTNLKTYGL
jgi:hypothetical protein